MQPNISSSAGAAPSVPVTYVKPEPSLSGPGATAPTAGPAASQPFAPLPLKSDVQQPWDFRQMAADGAPDDTALDSRLAAMANMQPIEPRKIPQQVREQQARDVLDRTMRHLDQMAGEYSNTREKMAASGDAEGIAELEDEISRFLASAERTMVALGAGIRKDQLDGPPSPTMEALLNFATSGFWSALREMQQKMQAVYDKASHWVALDDQEATCQEILRLTVEKLEIVARQMAVEKGHGHKTFRPESLPEIIRMLTQLRNARMKAEGLLNASRNSLQQASSPFAGGQASRPGDVDNEEAQ